jgi:Ca2+-binding RTX toxin-like protein
VKKWLMVFAMAALVVPAVAYAAVIVCHGGTCNGTDKADTIIGSLLPEAIYGKGGDDTITDVATTGVSVAEPNDIIRGNAGNDTITDNLDPTDLDRVYGNGGNDTIDVHDAVQVVVPIQGINTPLQDWVDCGDGNDTVKVNTADIVKNCETVIRS